MTIDEAIETLTNEHRRTWGDGFPKIRDALKLSIEALKRLKEASPWPHEYFGGPLVGEHGE